MKRIMFAIIVLAFLIPNGEVMTQTKDLTQAEDLNRHGDLTKPVGMVTLGPGSIDLDQITWIRIMNDRINRAAILIIAHDPSPEDFDDVRRIFDRTLVELNKKGGIWCPPGSCPFGPACKECDPLEYPIRDMYLRGYPDKFLIEEVHR